jgi:hypothetical protein
MKSTLLLLATLALGASGGARAHAADPAEALNRYRADLMAFRAEYGGVRDMPDVPFFQFGMGNRAKYLFKDGVLSEALTGKEFRNWGKVQALIVPSEYTVVFTNAQGALIRIAEDEKGAWIEENARKLPLPNTEGPIRLPRFSDYRYAPILRVLHHEILVNVVEGRPVPNLYVYKKPWYRDGAMMAMCLKATGNLDLIRDWVSGLQEVFDRNNAGESEADNPGQVLYLISLVSDRTHPLVPAVLKSLKALEVSDDHGLYIQGRSDFAEHPVYQTKWAKFGLRALGLADPYSIPAVRDTYSSLFWMDYREAHVAGAEATDRGFYPYLGWATDHFQRKKLSPISNRDYPLTWEIRASQADYEGVRRVHSRFTTEKTCVPHTWHAAEIFLYLLDPA